ncbi:MAG: hypothetical protein IPK83_20705 [Planctomycetes bacterium]|nr:hypothetical protein [Planctomycetota bacterium]
MHSSNVANRERSGTAGDARPESRMSRHEDHGHHGTLDGECFACPYCDARHADISGYTLHVIRRHGDGRVV